MGKRKNPSYNASTGQFDWNGYDNVSYELYRAILQTAGVYDENALSPSAYMQTLPGYGKSVGFNSNRKSKATTSALMDEELWNEIVAANTDEYGRVNAGGIVQYYSSLWISETDLAIIQKKAEDLAAQSLQDFENDYNDPASQVQRMKQAGINADLNGIENTESASAEVSDPVNFAAYGANDIAARQNMINSIFGAFDALNGAISTAIQMRNSIAQVDYLNQQARGQELINEGTAIDNGIKEITLASDASNYAKYIVDLTNGKKPSEGTITPLPGMNPVLSGSLKVDYKHGLKGKGKDYMDAAFSRYKGSRQENIQNRQLEYTNDAIRFEHAQIKGHQFYSDVDSVMTAQFKHNSLLTQDQLNFERELRKLETQYEKDRIALMQMDPEDIAGGNLDDANGQQLEILNQSYNNKYAALVNRLNYNISNRYTATEEELRKAAENGGWFARQVYNGYVQTFAIAGHGVQRIPLWQQAQGAVTTAVKDMSEIAGNLVGLAK